MIMKSDSDYTSNQSIEGEYSGTDTRVGSETSIGTSDPTIYIGEQGESFASESQPNNTCNKKFKPNTTEQKKTCATKERR